MAHYARFVAVLVATVLAGSAAISAQLSFEVASVRPNTSGPGGTFMRRLPGVGFEAGNVTPRDLILFAYDIQRFYVVGMPAWIETERFDISARTGASVPPPSTGVSVEWLMVRTLLQDRFRLSVHTETRQMPVYALLLARSDGQLGPQLRRSQMNCMNAPAPGATVPANAERCANRNNPPGVVSGVGREMPSFVFPLAGYVQRAVVDRTGLTGTWDIDLTFNPDGLAGSPASPDDPRPSLFTALQEQLGLRLEPSMGPVEVLVIDRIERPTAN